MLGIVSTMAHAQLPGSLDLSFNPDDVGHGTGDGALFAVKVSARQPDGKILIGGLFTNVNGYPRGYMARLEPDGRLDLGFVPSFNAEVSAITVQADGKAVLAAGRVGVETPGAMAPDHRGVVRVGRQYILAAAFVGVADHPEQGV